MARKRQIVSINFMSNFVFLGWKQNPVWGWCTVGGRTYWNSKRFVSQTCLTTQSHKHTCAHRPAATTADTQSWALPFPSWFPLPAFLSWSVVQLCSARSGSTLLCSAFPISLWDPHVCFEWSLEFLCFSSFSHLTPVFLEVCLWAPPTKQQTFIECLPQLQAPPCSLPPWWWHIISLPKCCLHHVISLLSVLK